jgi:hypothetical protein
LALKEQQIPFGYIGLDLWFYYDKVGLVRKYRADKKKYPNGLRAIRDLTGIPFFLHMGAFDIEGEELTNYEFILDSKSCYPKSSDYYVDLADRFKREGAIGVWHDWLWFQQGMVEELRNTIGAADRWFLGMTDAFEAKDLVMMLCMPTIGFYLASTRSKNVIATRTYTDYFIEQEKQVDMLERKIHLPPVFLGPWVVERIDYLKNNLFLGMLAHALGLYPFYDVFITNAKHPEGFEEQFVEQEALLRALSAGLVGIGDKVGEIDKSIVDKLCFPDGTLAKTDHPPYVLQEYLEKEPIMVFYSKSIIGAMKWIYLFIFNTADKPEEYEVNTSTIGGTDYIVYDYFNDSVVDNTKGTLGPLGYHYYILVPRVERLAFIGFIGKYVTMPSYQVKSISKKENGLEVSLFAPKGYEYVLGIYTKDRLSVETEGADLLGLDMKNNIYTIRVKPQNERFKLIFK